MASQSAAVERLARLTGWSGRSYVTPDWDGVERALGLSLPGEYKELLSVFPPGMFVAPRAADGHVIVHPPYADYLAQFETELDELREWRAAHPADVPRPVFPEPGGMLPWARAARECLLWVRDSADPAGWTVAVSNGGTWRYREELPVVEEFDRGAVEFLIGLVTGEIRSRVLNPRGFVTPAERGRVARAFQPLPQDEWLAYSQQG